MFVDCLHIEMGKQPCLDLQPTNWLSSEKMWIYPFFEVQDKIPKHYIYLWMEEILQLVTIGRWDYNRINHLHKFVKDFFHPQLIFNYIHTLGEATLSILWVSLSWGTLRQSGNMRHPKGKIPWLTFFMTFTHGFYSWHTLRQSWLAGESTSNRNRWLSRLYPSINLHLSWVFMDIPWFSHDFHGFSWVFWNMFPGFFDDSPKVTSSCRAVEVWQSLRDGCGHWTMPSPP